MSPSLWAFCSACQSWADLPPELSAMSPHHLRPIVTLHHTSSSSAYFARACAVPSPGLRVGGEAPARTRPIPLCGSLRLCVPRFSPALPLLGDTLPPKASPQGGWFSQVTGGRGVCAVPSTVLHASSPSHVPPSCLSAQSCSHHVPQPGLQQPKGLSHGSGGPSWGRRCWQVGRF